MKIVSCVLKVLNNGSNIPSSLKELLLRRGNYARPKVYSIKQGLRSWRYLAPNIWNALAEAVRHETKLSSFKRRLKKIDVTQLYWSVNSFNFIIMIIIIKLYINLSYFIADIFSYFYIVDRYFIMYLSIFVFRFSLFLFVAISAK